MPQLHHNIIDAYVSTHVRSPPAASEALPLSGAEELRSYAFNVAVSRGRLYTASKDKTSKVWDYATGACIRTVTGHQGWVTGIVVDSNHMYTSSWDKTVRQTDLETGNLLREFVGHSLWVTSLALRDGHLFTSSADCTVIQWNVETGERMACFHGHKDAIWAVVADAGPFIYTCSQDTTAMQWDIRTGKASHLFEGHTACVWCLALTELYLFTGSEDKTAKQWSLSTGLVVREFAGHPTEIRSLAVNEGSLFTGLVDGQVMQWQVETGRRLRYFHDHNLEVTAIAVADGFLFTGSDDCSARQHWVTWSGGSLPGEPAAQERFFAEKILALYNELGSVAASVGDIHADGGALSQHVHGEEELARLKLELEHIKSFLGTHIRAKDDTASLPPPPPPTQPSLPTPPLEKPSSTERIARLEKAVSQSREASTAFTTKESPWPTSAMSDPLPPETPSPTPEVPTPLSKATSPAERLRARSKMNLQGKIGLPSPQSLPSRPR